MSKEDAMLLDGLCDRKMGFYRRLFEYDKEKQKVLLEFSRNEIIEDLEHLSLGHLPNYNK